MTRLTFTYLYPLILRGDKPESFFRSQEAFNFPTSVSSITVSANCRLFHNHLKDTRICVSHELHERTIPTKVGLIGFVVYRYKRTVNETYLSNKMSHSLFVLIRHYFVSFYQRQMKLLILSQKYFNSSPLIEPLIFCLIHYWKTLTSHSLGSLLKL